MENQTEVLEQVATNPATLPTPNPAASTKKPETYTHRIRKMSDKALKSEVRIQGAAEMRRSNGMGIILATVLEVFVEGHVNGRAPYLR